MSTKITNKQVKIISNVDFNEKEIENAIIDAEKNEITNLDIPTKVSDLENDSGYTTTADVNSEIIANSSYMDNALQEDSFNAVTNDAITKGIEKNKVSVLDRFVDTLPIGTLTLGQSVYNTTDNKIYKTTYNKEIESDVFNTVGSLLVDTKGIITGFSEDNYLYSNSEWLGENWVGWRINKLVFSIAEARYYSTTTIFSIIRRDDNSVLFGIDFFNRGFGSGTLTFYTKRRDGTTVESATVNAAPSSRYELEITSSNYIKLICAGKTELIRYFGSLSGSDDVEDDFYYGISADIKISSKRVTQYPSTYILGIGKLYGMESIIAYQYQGSPATYHIVWRGSDIIWDEGTAIEKGKFIYDAENYNLYEYDGTKLISILPDMDKYQKKLTAGDNITISGEGYLGFSDTNYLEFINNIAEQTPRVARDFLIKFKLTEINRNNTLLYSAYDTNKYCLLEITNENKLRCTYINSSGNLRIENGTHVFQANKEYWIMVTTDYYPQYIYFLEDNGYTINTLPSDISAWTFDIESSYIEYMLFVNIGGSLYLGYNNNTTNNFLKGSISECRIKNSGGHAIFTLSEAVESETFINHGCLKGPAISAIVPENANIQVLNVIPDGTSSSNLTREGAKIKGFGRYAYLKFGAILDNNILSLVSIQKNLGNDIATANSFECVFLVNYKAKSSVTKQYLFGESGTSASLIGINGEGLCSLAINYSGSSGGSTTETGSFSFTEGSDYYFKLVFDGSKYTLSVKEKTATEYTIVATITNSTKITGKRTWILGYVDTTNTNNEWNSYVDLSKSYIKIDGEYWWKGVETL